MYRFIYLFLMLLPTFVLGDFNLRAKNAVLIDANTGQILYKKEAFKPVPPSSMSKLMTAYILLEDIKNKKIKSTTKFKVSEKSAYNFDSGESAMYLKAGQNVSAIDLYKGMMIMSGGDACRTVAEGLEGSIEKFVERMNLTAKKLGLRNSSFRNPTGMAENGHLMSVYDVAKLSKIFMKFFPEYYKILKQKYFNYKGYSEEEKKEYEFAMWNRNKLLWTYRGADGIKTGHTSKGGYALAASAKKGDFRLIAVINGLVLRLGRNSANRERAKESGRLLDYGFENFQQQTFYKKNEKILEIPVWFGKKNTAKVGADNNVFLTMPKENPDKIEVKAIYKTPIISPVKKGQKLGKIKIFVEKKEVLEYNLIALEDVKRISFGLRLFENLKILIKRL